MSKPPLECQHGASGAGNCVSPATPTVIPSTWAADTMWYPVIHKVGRQRFEMRIGNEPPAFVSYTRQADHIILEHTYVPETLRGNGVAAALTKAALREAEKRAWKIDSRCQYVTRFIQGHPEFAARVVSQTLT